MDNGGQKTAGATRTSASALGADEIIPRDIRFGVGENPERHWFGGDPVKTALIDALSLWLPEGERYFIRALKHYANTLDDRELAREINGYAVQEAFHTREHEDYNRGLSALGYPVEKMEQPIRFTLRQGNSPMWRLATTCAIEHITATFSSFTLRAPGLLDDASPRYRRLWMWHALEELEHKAVALDVFAAATRHMSPFKRYLFRVSAMNTTVITFTVLTIRNIRLIAKADGLRPGVRYWSKFLYVMLVYPGFWRLSALPFLRYYLPGFDPRNVDDVDLIHKGRDWLAGELTADYKVRPNPAT